MIYFLITNFQNNRSRIISQSQTTNFIVTTSQIVSYDYKFD